MPVPGRASQTKRNRERANRERKEEKRAERDRRKEEKKQQKDNAVTSGVDPDLIGIVPGPHNLPQN